MNEEWYVDGGDDGSKLSMDSIINKTCPLNEYVLYAEFMDSAPAVSAFENLQTALGEGSNSQLLIDDIAAVDTMLSATESNRFYLGEEAQLNITNMHNISETVSSLREKVAAFDTTQLSADISTYNANLAELKKDARRDLLKARVSELNGMNLEYPGYPKTEFFKYDNNYEIHSNSRGYSYDYQSPHFQSITGDNDCEVVETERFNEGANIVDKRADGGEYHEYSWFSVRYHHYRRVSYSQGIWESFNSFFDTKFTTVEERLHTAFDSANVGDPVPYDPDKIAKNQILIESDTRM